MITSYRNPLIKRIKRLRQRKYRREERAFFVEGPRAFLAAVETGAPLEAVVYSRQLLRSEPCYAAIAQLAAQGVTCEEVTAELFAGVAERENPAGIGAVVKTASSTLAELQVNAGSLFVALVEPSDPGNIGAILRTLDAIGGAALILVGNSADPFHPTAVKASMGSLFTVPLCEVDDLADVLAWARQRGVQTAAASARAAQIYWDVAYRTPTLFLMGSERHGLDAAALDAADLRVTIPMQGSVTSLNLAIAASLLLYEAIRQRQPKQPELC